MDGVSFDPYTALYERGTAVGFSDVKTDSVAFRFRDEQFQFPSGRVFPYMKWNGYFYEADINELRKLEAEAAAG